MVQIHSPLFSIPIFFGCFIYLYSKKYGKLFIPVIALRIKMHKQWEKMIIGLIVLSLFLVSCSKQIVVDTSTNEVDDTQTESTIEAPQKATLKSCEYKIDIVHDSIPRYYI